MEYCTAGICSSAAIEIMIEHAEKLGLMDFGLALRKAIVNDIMNPLKLLDGCD